MKQLFGWVLIALCGFDAMAAEPLTLNLWPGKPPGETKELPPEADQTKPEDKLIAGRRIIKLERIPVSCSGSLHGGNGFGIRVLGRVG